MRARIIISDAPNMNITLQHSHLYKPLLSNWSIYVCRMHDRKHSVSNKLQSNKFELNEITMFRLDRAFSKCTAMASIFTKLLNVYTFKEVRGWSIFGECKKHFHVSLFKSSGYSGGQHTVNVDICSVFETIYDLSFT